MEDATSPNSTEMTSTDKIVRALEQQRNQAKAFLTAQRERLANAEAQLAERIGQVAQELSQAQAEIRRTEDAQSSREKQLGLEAENLARLKEGIQTVQAQWSEAQDRAASQQRQLADEIHARQDALGKRFDELSERGTQIAEAEARLKHEQQKLALAQAEVARANEQLLQTREDLEKKYQQLETEREALARRHAETEEQRHRIAVKLEEQRLNQRREQENLLEQWKHNRDEAASADEASQSAENRLRELESRLSESTEHEAQLENELSAARRACAELQEQLAERAAGEPSEETERQTELLSEREALIDRLTLSETRLSHLQQQLDVLEDQGVSVEEGEYQKRYEMAMDDLRSLKARNEELETQLRKTPRSGKAIELSPGADKKWEAQKQQLMAVLNDLDEEDEEEASRRQRIEEVIETTEAAIIMKDQKIAELQQIVEQRNGHSTPGETIEKDSIIQQEREKLRQLQLELKSELRQAEIDISIERAEIARQRIEIEEVMRQFAEEAAHAQIAAEGSSKGAEPATGRRWLARLGVKSQDDDS